MRRVKRAIIVAAGRGERLRPLTDTVPKPMIPVNGIRMIDTVLRALRINGIREIHIVTGYLAEAFDALKAEYPEIDLIFNPWYDRANNIASLYCAREYLENAMILDGDQIIRDPSALSPEFELSGYNAVWTDEETREWLMTVENGVVTGCSRDGGKNGWQLYSVSRWSAEDGARLRRHLEEAFENPETRGIYWDDVAMFLHPEAYRLGIHPMTADAVREIDTLEELLAEERRGDEDTEGGSEA